MITSRGTSYTITKGNGMRTAPSNGDVDQVMDLLQNDPDFLIAASVNNQPGVMRDRYQQITGDTRKLSPSRLIGRLQEMRATGKKSTVVKIIGVPWHYAKGDALDQAMRALAAEAAARANDPSVVLAKSGTTPYGPGNEYFDPFTGESSSSGSAAGNGGGDEGGSSFDLNAFLQSAVGIIGLLTGGGVSNQGPDTAPPAPASSTNWMAIILGVLGLGVLVTVIVLVAKKG